MNAEGSDNLPPLLRPKPTSYREGKGAHCSLGTRFQFCKAKQVLWGAGGDGSTTVGMCLMPLSCALKNG